ncbi:MAG: marine proteobacterial sortase target protein [Geminicoccaceae bacterium]
MNRGPFGPLVFLVCCLVATTARADATIEPLRFRGDVKNGFVTAPGIASELQIQVEGTIIRTTVTQYFLNDTNAWQEGIYQFPLPDDAAVDSLTMMVGERRVIGFVTGKEEAKQIYEEAKAEGQAAGLVDQNRPNLFKTSVANIPPKSLIAIEIQYQGGVRLDGERFSLRVPLAITPRYDRMSEEQLRHLVTAADQAWAEELVDRLALVDVDGGNNPVDLRVDLRPGFPLGSLESASHAIETTERDDGDAHEISLARGVTPGSSDFTLEWTPAPNTEPYEALYAEALDNGHYSLLLMMAPPNDAESAADGPRPKRQVTYIIDVSGSMDGPSIRQAKKALLLALDDLGDDDLFNVIAFNDGYWTVFPDAVPATAERIEAASSAVGSLRADGGTEMMPPLIEALSEPESAAHLRQIVFITDGAIGYENQMAATIKKLAGEARFFAIGIGSAPNAHLMRHIAMAGRGSYTFIDDVNAVERELAAVFEKMTSPVLTDLELVLPDGVDAELFPEKLPDLLAGEPISVAIRSSEPLTSIGVRGQRDGQPWERASTIDRPRSADGIGKIFARRKIQALNFDGLGQNDPELAGTIEEIAIRHQLVSDYTSLVAVDEAILRPDGAPLTQRRFDPTLPLGWQEDRLKALEAEAAYRRLKDLQNEDDAGDAPENSLLQPISLPQTATGFELHLLFGLALMFSGALLLLVRRRPRHG